EFDRGVKDELVKLFQLLARHTSSASRVLVTFPTEVTEKETGMERVDGILIPVVTPVGYEIPKWIFNLGKRHGLFIEDQAVDLIHQKLGDDLSHIDLELAKLKNVIVDGVVTESVAQNYLSASALPSPFDLVHKFFTKQTVPFVSGLTQFFSAGESAFAFVFHLGRVARMMVKYIDLYEHNLPVSTIAQELRVPVWQVKKMHQYLPHWQKHQLNQLLWELYQWEYRQKSKSLNQEEELLNHLITGTIHC
ncbi:MAG: hypothetical protein NZ480_02540, partial [Bdellovibrionaceae bacterium]|nr:hypothetical protein [Pseudobdellovibrionaceae bacterium]MDW8190825.1 hypothetical protein [Pseudobdellovibrionaceae bacterium]